MMGRLVTILLPFGRNSWLINASNRELFPALYNMTGDVDSLKAFRRKLNSQLYIFSRYARYRRWWQACRPERAYLTAYDDNLWQLVQNIRDIWLICSQGDKRSVDLPGHLEKLVHREMSLSTAKLAERPDTANALELGCSTAGVAQTRPQLLSRPLVWPCNRRNFYGRTGY